MEAGKERDQCFPMGSREAARLANETVTDQVHGCHSPIVDLSQFLRDGAPEESQLGPQFRLPSAPAVRWSAAPCPAAYSSREQLLLPNLRSWMTPLRSMRDLQCLLVGQPAT